MKNIVLFFFGVFSFIKSPAQFEYFTVNSENYIFFPLEGLSESIGMETPISFGYNITEDTLVIAMMQSDQTVVIGHTVNDYFFNGTKMNTPEWRNDSIFISSEMPYRATTWNLTFVWDKNVQGFFMEEPEMYDPSSEALEKAENYIAQGNIQQALNWYQSIFYPQSYINEPEVGREIIEKSHQKALEFFKANQNDTAVFYMQMALDYYPNMYYTDFKSEQDMKTQMEESPYQIIWTIDQMKLWLGDYGLFLYKAKKYDESIAHNSYMNTIFPELAGPYLQLGDSYFDSGKKTEAKAAYKRYIALKNSQKKEKDIPKRVKERIK